MENKRLVIIQPNAHKVYWGWYKYLNKYYDLYVITPPSNEKIPFLREKHLELEVKKNLFSLISGGFFFDYKNLDKLLKEINPSVILSKIYFISYTLTALNFAKKNKKEFIIVEEQKDFPSNFFERILFKLYLYLIRPILKSVPIICVTKDSYKFIKNNKIGSKKYYLPVSYWDENKRIISHVQDKLRLIYVGRYVDTKNITIVLKAIKYLKDNKKISEKDFEFGIYGSGELKDEYKDYVKKHNLEVLVKVNGRIENSKLKDLFKKYNVFILPSLKDPIGLVVLEAMNSSLPIVCSLGAGASSYIKNNLNGFTFSPTNIKELAEILLKLKNKKLREKMGKESFRILKTELSQENVGKKLINILKANKIK